MATKKEIFKVQVDKYGHWKSGEYRDVTKEELDEIIRNFGTKLMNMCGAGSRGAMTMWAYFKNKINIGSYTDIINAYDLLSGDSRSLVDKEHEFRQLLEQYMELHYIRYFGTLADYYYFKYLEAQKHYNEHTEGVRDCPK